MGAVVGVDGPGRDIIVVEPVVDVVSAKVM